MYRASHLSLVLVATIVIAASARPAYAAGYYNLPTSMQQCMGLGYGPGYHAPLLLSRSYKARGATQRVKRIPAPLSPPPHVGLSAVSSWATSCEAGHCGGSLSFSHALNDSVGGYSAVVEESKPAFAPPTLVVPQQAVAPQYLQPNYPAPSFQAPATGPLFPSARAPQKPPLLW